MISSPILLKLNIGCGTNILPGYINLDRVSLPGVDVTHDLNQASMPFESNSFDEILCRDILEHVDFVPVMRELYRVLKKGGILKIRVPHFTSSTSYSDPTHIRLFTIRTFDFFTQSSDRNYYLDYAFYKVLRSQILIEKGYEYGFPKILKFFISGLLSLFEFWINRTRKWQCFYEDSFLSRLFPGRNIELILIK